MRTLKLLFASASSSFPSGLVGFLNVCDVSWLCVCIHESKFYPAKNLDSFKNFNHTWKNSRTFEILIFCVS